MDKPSRYIIEREIKDITRYLEATESDKHLYDKNYLKDKERRLAELKEMLKEC